MSLDLRKRLGSLWQGDNPQAQHQANSSTAHRLYGVDPLCVLRFLCYWIPLFPSNFTLPQSPAGLLLLCRGTCVHAASFVRIYSFYFMPLCTFREQLALVDATFRDNNCVIVYSSVEKAKQKPTLNRKRQRSRPQGLLGRHRCPVGHETWHF